MSYNIWQCCYTNSESREGGFLKTGWGEVACSDDLPSDAREECVLYQGRNSRINTEHVFSDESLYIYEIFGDSRYIYIMKSFFGLKDYAGRPNMFSHAYIMSWTDELLKDPNKYLCLSQENFTSSESVAEEKKNNIHDIIYDPELKLPEIIDDLKLSTNNLARLIKSVYLQATDKRLFKPLYVQYDGNQGSMIKLLYCIYTGLPFEMRKSLKASSDVGENSDKTNIIFSKEAFKTDCYINPFTGENNILSDRENMHLDKIRFVDYAVKTFKGEKDYYDYFKKLEETVSLCDDTEKSKEKLYMLSFFINGYEKPESLQSDELQNLADVLFNEIDIKNIKLQEFLSDLIYLLTERKEGLYRDNENTLIKMLYESDSLKELKDRAYSYFEYRFSVLAPKSAGRLLEKFNDEDKEKFKHLIKTETDEHHKDDTENYGRNMPESHGAEDENGVKTNVVNNGETNAKINEKESNNENNEEERLLKERVKVFADKLCEDFPHYTYGRIFELISDVFNNITGEDISEEKTVVCESETFPKNDNEETECIQEMSEDVNSEIKTDYDNADVLSDTDSTLSDSGISLSESKSREEELQLQTMRAKEVEDTLKEENGTATELNVETDNNKQDNKNKNKKRKKKKLFGLI